MVSAFLFLLNSLRSFLFQGQRRQRNKSCAGTFQGCRLLPVEIYFEVVIWGSCLLFFSTRVYYEGPNERNLTSLRVHEGQLANRSYHRQKFPFSASSTLPNSRALSKIIIYKLRCIKFVFTFSRLLPCYLLTLTIQLCNVFFPGLPVILPLPQHPKHTLHKRGVNYKHFTEIKKWRWHWMNQSAHYVCGLCLVGVCLKH